MTWIEAPAREPRPNTSLDVIPVHDVASSHFVGYEFQGDPCVFPNPVPQDCYITIGPANGTEKTFGDAASDVATAVFGAYQGVECFLNGGLDDFRQVAQRILENGEQFVVDGQIAALLATTATATTPATATTVAGALALLEQELAEQVPAKGYIYMSPKTATLAASEHLLIRNLDGTLETYLGTPVVILTEPSMVNDIYASGPINLWRTPIVAAEAPSITNNMGRALAERLYSLSIECGVWKTTVGAL
jgi:hypothetical protein